MRATTFPRTSAKIRTPRLVPTTFSKTFRDSGRYDSSERLPNIDLLLDRTLRQIEHSHESRERHPRAFDTLWNKVCKKLQEKKNATAYAYWKQAEDVIKNRNEIKELDERWAAAWMSVVVNHGEGDQAKVSYRNAEEFEALHQERANLKPKIKVTTDDALEIAIAYWIEAKNARNEGDDLRVLYALTECHLYIGMTLSTKTESESKSESGKKQGKQARDAIAHVAVEVLRNIEIDKRMKDQDYLFGKVVQLIESSPQYAPILKTYDAQTTAGKIAANGTSISDRFAETLRKWATSKQSPYPEIAGQYCRIRYQLEWPQSSITKRSKRQVHS